MRKSKEEKEQEIKERVLEILGEATGEYLTIGMIRGRYHVKYKSRISINDAELAINQLGRKKVRTSTQTLHSLRNTEK